MVKRVGRGVLAAREYDLGKNMLYEGWIRIRYLRGRGAELERMRGGGGKVYRIGRRGRAGYVLTSSGAVAGGEM